MPLLPRRRPGALLVALLCAAAIAAGALLVERRSAPLALASAPPARAAAAPPVREAIAPANAASAVEPLPDSSRRELRRKLMKGCERERSEPGLEAGRRLRGHDALDWNAALCLGSLLRSAGFADEARSVYEDFVERYPENRFTKDVRRALAELAALPRERSLGAAGRPGGSAGL